MANIMGTNGSDNLFGTNLADTITAKNGADVVNARDGNDTVNGGGGNDLLNGGNGKDVINGGSGNDTLNGQGGNDSLIGGTGADTFRYNAYEGDDRIVDFDFGEGDLVDILNVTEAQLRAEFGNEINTGDPEVSNVGGDLVIDFGPTGLPGFGKLTLVDGFDNLGATGLLVGTDIV